MRRPAPAHVRATLLATAIAALLATPASAGSSGLPWRSGANSSGFPCLASLRGRPLDAVQLFVPTTSFPALVAGTASPDFRRSARQAPLAVVSLPLLTEDTKGRFGRCARGDYDGSFHQLGTNLRTVGGKVIARLGWEANIGSGPHPWGYDRADQLPAYRACFRRAAHALKATFPALRIEWANAKTGAVVGQFWDSYPGDDVVDLFGLLYYDQGLPDGGRIGTDARWDSFFLARSRGGPFGVGAWLGAAGSRGKRLAIGEWGLRDDKPGTMPADDPVFVKRMGVFFRAHAASIAYETFFNADLRHADGVMEHHGLCPKTVYPASRAAYAQGSWKK